MTRRRGVRVVGIDGGATYTRYVLADGTGGILRRSEGEGSLLGAGRDRAVSDELARRVSRLVREEGGDLPLEALCAGLAGAGSRPEAARAMERRVEEVGIARRARVVPDAEVAFVDAFGEGKGVLLVAGTGSIALARSEEGGTLGRVGGWGALLGDEGSGYRIGLEGLQAAVRAEEGRGTTTRLGAYLLGALELESVEGLLEWSREISKADIGRLAPVVAAAATDGDPVAEEIVRRAVEGLVDHVRAVTERVGTGGVLPVALVGGLIEAGGALHEAVTAALDDAGVPRLKRPLDPARGAVRLALRL